MNESKLRTILVGKSKRFLYAGGIILLVGFLLSSLASGLSSKNKEEEAVSYYSEALYYNDKANDYVYLDIDSAYMFAQDNDYGYYYCFDSNDFLYIVQMTDKQYQQIEEAYKQDTSDYFTYHLTGTLYNCWDELEELACNMAQEVFELPYSISQDQYDQYFLDTYLSVEVSNGSSTIITIMRVVSLSAMAASIALFILYFVNKVKENKMLANQETEEVIKELKRGHFSENKFSKIITMNDYLVSYSYGFQYIRYQDILWAYGKRISSNNDKCKLYIYDKVGGCVYGICDSEETIAYLTNTILEKNPSVIIGDNPTNQNLYNEAKAN